MISPNLETKIIGLIGHPLSHSLSPRLHNFAINDLNLNLIYLPFDIKPAFLKQAVIGLKALNMRGVNVTIPYKEKIIPYLDKLDQLAENIGAVNTVVNEQGCLKGYNTDALAFYKMLTEKSGFIIKEKVALIVGAGGASKAVGTVLAQHGIKKIYLINRSRKKAEMLAKKWQQKYNIRLDILEMEPVQYNRIIPEVDLIVDTTPVGMAPKVETPPVIDISNLQRDTLVVDLVYNPKESTLLKAARKKGAKILNGEAMLLYQAAEAFKLWTGKEPNINLWYELL